MKDDTVSRASVLKAIDDYERLSAVSQTVRNMTSLREIVQWLPAAQPEIIRCKDCVYGEQDDVGRWYCTSLGCQVGNEDGSGFCADAERREE